MVVTNPDQLVGPGGEEHPGCVGVGEGEAGLGGGGDGTGGGRGGHVTLEDDHMTGSMSDLG